jgi:hypothetical protein
MIEKKYKLERYYDGSAARPSRDEEEMIAIKNQLKLMRQHLELTTSRIMLQSKPESSPYRDAVRIRKQWNLH